MDFTKTTTISADVTHSCALSAIGCLLIKSLEETWKMKIMKELSKLSRQIFASSYVCGIQSEYISSPIPCSYHLILAANVGHEIETRRRVT